MNTMSRIVSFVLLASLGMLSSLATAAALPEFREIVANSSPAVVKIVVQQKVMQRDQGQPSPEEMPEYLLSLIHISEPTRPY